MSELDGRLKGWRGLVTRWPDRWYEVSEGCDALDMVALLILEVEGVATIRREGETVIFGGGGGKK